MDSGWRGRSPGITQTAAPCTLGCAFSQTHQPRACSPAPGIRLVFTQTRPHKNNSILFLIVQSDLKAESSVLSNLVHESSILQQNLEKTQGCCLLRLPNASGQKPPPNLTSFPKCLVRKDVGESPTTLPVPQNHCADEDPGTQTSKQLSLFPYGFLEIRT